MFFPAEEIIEPSRSIVVSSLPDDYVTVEIRLEHAEDIPRRVSEPDARGDRITV
jgi:hypothetical protein